jgi:LTXXQ motif family protein
MRKIGAIFRVATLTAIAFFPPPAAAFSIHVGSFYFHVPFVGHHRHRLHHGERYRSASRGAGNTEQTKREAVSPESCTGLVLGVTNLPIDQIRQTVRPTADQEAAFDDLGAASSQASDVIKSSCPSTVPLTPLGRLDAAEQRLDATIKAVQIVRLPLVKLYEALGDEQRRQFNAINGSAQRARSGDNVATPCSHQAGSFIDLPAQRIEEVLEPTPEQQSAFDDLRNATQRAADQLQSSCPTGVPQSPVARLDMVEAQLKVIADALKMVRPALENFYAALKDEQKAIFNIVGPRAE